VNVATVAELAEVSGIGPVLSREIVTYREAHGRFGRMEDLLEVPGIGPSRLEALRELFDVLPALTDMGAAPPPEPGFSGPSPRLPGAEAAADARDRRIDVNTASREDLEAVPGIGSVLAERIVRHREARGPFRRIEDLLEVDGIGERRAASFAAYLRFPDEGPHGSVSGRMPGSLDRLDPPAQGGWAGAPRRIDINRATKEELMALPGIGSVLAERIVESRRAAGPFTAPADVQRVEGIGSGKFEAIRDMIEAGP